jgi:hypothetical protein
MFQKLTELGLLNLVADPLALLLVAQAHLPRFLLPLLQTRAMRSQLEIRLFG